MASNMSLLERCSPATPLLLRFSQLFDICVPTPLALISTLLGVCSIVAWLFAQLPQIWTNYKLKSASGLSFYFLLEWLAGDLTNLLGAIFTRQASWQIVVAGYYVFVDVALFLQFSYFSYYNSRTGSRAHVTTMNAENFSGDEDENSIQHSSKDMAGDKHSSPGNASPTSKRSANKQSKSQSPQGSSKHFNVMDSEKRIPFLPHGDLFEGGKLNGALVAPMLFAVAAQARPLHDLAVSGPIIANTANINPLEMTGRVLSWISTLLYLGSRLPQIYKNHIRKSTSGLEPQLFIAAFFGNLF